MRKWFVNPNEGRLRAGWRILLFLVLFVGSNVVIQTAFKAANGGIPDGSEYVRSATLFVMVAFAATFSVLVARKLIDRRSIVSLGIGLNRFTLPDIVIGFAISATMAAMFFFLAQALHLVEVTGVNWVRGDFDSSDWQALSRSLASMGLSTLLVLLAVDMIVSWWEEIVFRGYVWQNLADGLKLGWAIAVSCIVYGWIHVMNPSATFLSFLIIIGFGFVRLYGVLLTNLIWLSFGMHAGWNFFQGVIFGFNASGNETASILEVKSMGPTWLSGGDFGPEGSVLMVPILIFGALAMRSWDVMRNRSVPI